MRESELRDFVPKSNPLTSILSPWGRGGFAALLVMLAACEAEQAVVIDGSSQQAFESTTKAARRQLPDADRLIFDRALRTIGGRRHSARDTDALARVTFDGMTAEQVVADQRQRD